MRNALTFTLIALISTGCATVSSTAPPTAAAQQKFAVRDLELASLGRWSFSGRIAVQTGNDGGSGTIHWTQQGQNYAIEIRGPVVSRTARLNRSEQGSVLRLSDEQSFAGDDARTLLAEHFGWDIPVDALQLWIIGRFAPNLDKQFELDDTGRLLHLRQLGWDVEYKRYVRVDNFDLPEKIFARNERAQLRLFVDEWSTQ